MEDWLQAIGRPKMGRVMGIPQVPAYTLVPAARSRRRPPTGGSGASGSGIDPSLSDDFFRWIIEGCMASSVVHSGVPSCEGIYQFAQEVFHGSIDPIVVVDDLMGVVREEVIRVCALILANILPPYIRQVLVDETRGVEAAAQAMTAELMLMRLWRVGPTVGPEVGLTMGLTVIR